MATTTRTPEEIRTELSAEREELAGAVEQLRDELGEATNITGKLQSKLPLVAAGAASAAFVLAGGVGATFRYFARRGREQEPMLRVGRWSIFDRD
jgi:shikimate kinase